MNEKEFEISLVKLHDKVDSLLEEVKKQNSRISKNEDKISNLKSKITEESDIVKNKINDQFVRKEEFKTVKAIAYSLVGAITFWALNQLLNVISK